MITLSSEQPVVRVHRRQFVIGPRAFLARPDWRTFELQPGLVLSADPELRVGQTTDLDGVPWFLLGLAADTQPDCLAPLAELSRRRTNDVPELYQGWAGRWALAGAGRLHLDATATLGCYYGKNAGGECWASSSPVLIEQALGSADTMNASAGWRPLPEATVSGAVRGVSWYPPPHSPLPGVFRLLPSQILALQQGSCQPRPLAAPRHSSGSDQALYESLALAIKTAIQGIARYATDDLTLLLSGGRDSRLLLSIVAAAGLPVKTYTRIHRRASLADQILPPKLARMTGYSHAKHYQRRELPGRRQAIAEHAGYSVSWLSAEEFLRGGSDPLRGIALAGFCSALGRDRLLPVSSAREATGELIARHFREADSPDLVAAFDAWIALKKADADPRLDLCDYFFLEQRTAGRRAAKEQLFDLFPAERVSPLNSARIFALICNLSAEVKLKALWIPEIIAAARPDLLRYPMNPPDRYFGVVRNALQNNRLYRKALTF